MVRLRSCLLALTAVFLAASPAQGAAPDNEIFTVVEELKTDNVVLLPGAELGLQEELEAALEDSSIGLVVLPRSASMESYNGLVSEEFYVTDEESAFAEAVYEHAQHEGYRTIIVVSKNKVAVDSNQSAETIKTMLADTNADNTQAIVLNRGKIEDYNEITRGEWLPWVGVPVGLVLLVALAVGGWNAASEARWRYRQWRNKRANARKAKQARELELRQQERERARAQAIARREAIVQDLSKDIPKDLRDRLDAMQKWAAEHIAPRDRAFAKDIKVMVERFQILFQRINERGTGQQKKMALVSYTDMLEKISSALSEKYYLDILAHPDLWDDPEGRIAQVKRAVEGTKAQLLENIKQVNASQDLDFKAALESLAGFMEAPRVEDLYRDQP